VVGYTTVYLLAGWVLGGWIKKQGEQTLPLTEGERAG
jgi:hypothetical protein